LGHSVVTEVVDVDLVIGSIALTMCLFEQYFVFEKTTIAPNFIFMADEP